MDKERKLGGYKSIRRASGEWHKKVNMGMVEENAPGRMTGMVVREVEDKEAKARERGGERGGEEEREETLRW